MGNKEKIAELYKTLLPSEYSSFSKAKKFFCNSIIFLLIISIFTTVLFQAPIFAEHSINHLSNVLWIVAFVCLFVFDYKLVVNRILKMTALFAPFLLYLLIAFFCGLPSFTGSSFIQPLILTYFISIIFWSFSNLYQKKHLKVFLSAYLLGAFLLGIIVYITTLRGADISSSIYAYKSKNSTGPILLVACCCAFFVLDQKKIVFQIAKYLLYVFFVVLIALMKCRTVLFVLPIIFLILLRYKTKRNWVIFVSLFSLFAMIMMIFLVPTLREKILINIILSGHQNITIDEFFSGRLSSIAENMSKFNKHWLLGTCSSYVDCMPILVIINFGILGAMSLLPVLAFPFLIFADNIRHSSDLNNKRIQCLVIIAFSIFLFFEGLIPFGPGSETFIFWFVLLVNNDKTYGVVSSKIENFIQKIVTPITATTLTYCVSSLLAVISFLFVTIGPVFRPASMKVTSLLPIDHASSVYTEPKSISIDGPTKMCVGQKVRFKSSIEPFTATDVETRWTTWATNNDVSVDMLTGEVTANKKTSAASIVSYSSKITSIVSYLPVSVVDPYDFDFDPDKIQLSLDRNNNLLIGDAVNAIYDINYVPDVSLLEFCSSNPSVATIDNYGAIKCLSLGNTEIYVKTKTKNPVESKHIYLSVNPGTIVDIQTINLELEDNLFSNVYYDYSVLFNEGVCDRRFQLVSDHFQFETADNKIRFNNYGDGTLTVIASGNPSITKTLYINVQKNEPVALCYHGTNWISVGAKQKIELFVEYESGHEVMLDASQLLYTTSDYGKRAWHGKNGLVDDEFTIAGMASGPIKIVYTLRENQDISTSISLTCSKYSEGRYLTISYTIGLTVIDIFIMASMVGLLSKKWKRKNLPFLILCSLLFVATIIIGLSVYTHTAFALVANLLVALMFPLLLFVFHKKTISFELFCETFQSYNCEIKTVDFYEIII